MLKIQNKVFYVRFSDNLTIYKKKVKNRNYSCFLYYVFLRIHLIRVSMQFSVLFDTIHTTGIVK